MGKNHSQRGNFQKGHNNKGNQNHKGGQSHKGGQNSFRKRKAVTAVTFDENERHEYLSSMVGAKRRRREFYKNKVAEETKK